LVFSKVRVTPACDDPFAGERHSGLGLSCKVKGPPGGGPNR